ncbi:hypothetical protein DYB28_013614 [Aphanomyces astaci]|uniref:PLAC8 family protein n=1 Tax=Aphanomyces astaci TaxID=112090 RepID=A0A397F6B0_APHAT|nr:hypothetical protein DYB34_012756 [Aphanomyces astaci]RHZ11923.1 hypothetical protein DYB31_013912 [Aphanomyces astaci]RHZ26956.1 hypothetical protein DYB26_004761 [Aphanomyces astaci]RLO02868.1 hypothetical protein DYB28_013614 [Aphanomyces astaci]
MSSPSPTNKAASPVNKADYMAENMVESVPTAVPVDPSTVPMHPGVDHNGLVVGRWKADVFGCFTDCVPNCLMASCCPCVSLAQTVHRIGMYTFTNALLVFGALYITTSVLSILQSSSMSSTVVYNRSGWVVYSTTSTIWSWISLCVQILSIVLIMVIRKRFRITFQIPGSDCDDCCCSFFCSCCVMAQMATHAEAYTPHECTFGPKDTLAGYQF